MAEVDPPIEWLCAKCGNPAKPIESPFGSHTAIAGGFTTGYCDTCTVANPKSPRKKPRLTSQLIDARRFDRAVWEERREREELRKLVQTAGLPRVSLSDHEVVRLVELGDKYGTPGLMILPTWREAAEKASAGGRR